MVKPQALTWAPVAQRMSGSPGLGATHAAAILSDEPHEACASVTRIRDVARPLAGLRFPRGHPLTDAIDPGIEDDGS